MPPVGRPSPEQPREAALEESIPTLLKFINAATWDASRQIVEQHPELLDPALDASFDRVAPGRA